MVFVSKVLKCRLLPVGTKQIASHHRSPGGKRRGKRKRSTIFLERTREGHTLRASLSGVIKETPRYILSCRGHSGGDGGEVMLNVLRCQLTY